MPCRQCKIDMNGKYFVLNVNAALIDNTETWVSPPKGQEVSLRLTVNRHEMSTETHKGEDIWVDDFVPREVDIFGKMCNYNNCSGLGDKQAEEYFCSKECLIDWFANQLKGI